MKRYKGRYINDKMFRTCPDKTIEIPQENGLTELRREIDAICILPRRAQDTQRTRQKRRKQIIRKILSVLGTLGIFLGAAAAVIYMAPAFGTILFAVIAWCGFAVAMTGAE